MELIFRKLREIPFVRSDIMTIALDLTQIPLQLLHQFMDSPQILHRVSPEHWKSGTVRSKNLEQATRVWYLDMLQMKLMN